MKLSGRAKLAFLNLIGVGGKGRYVRTRPTDRFIVGYPKSGNTWLDFLVASLISDRVEDVNFKTINAIVGDVHTLSPWELHRLPDPRVLKSHDYFSTSFPKIVHIVRHPYDVAVSYYYFLIKGGAFDEAYTLREFVFDWIRGNWGEGFGTWEYHGLSWIEGLASENRHMLRYEDLKKDTAGELTKAADFLGISVTPNKIAEAVAWCQPENMNRLEKDGLSIGFRGFGSKRPDIDFVRTAQSRKRASLTDEDKNRIATAWKLLMDDLGYSA